MPRTLPRRRRIVAAVAALAWAAPAVAAQTGADSGAVQAAMRGVSFHVDRTIILRIESLRGSLIPARAGVPPRFDDSDTYLIQIDAARIALSARDLGDLLNRFVFNYRGAPLHSLRVTIEGDRIRQRGRLHGLPFSILSEVTVTPGGEIRLHPVAMKAFGIPVRGILHLFGMELERMVNLRRARGIRAEHDDLLLLPAELLPPPRIRGRLARVELRDSLLVQTFRPVGPAGDPPPLAPPGSPQGNFMYFQGQTLRFGKLTMAPADLLILDADSRDPFDFYLARYNDQLVAGSSRNTASGGLITTMPDFAALARRTPATKDPPSQ